MRDILMGGMMIRSKLIIKEMDTYIKEEISRCIVNLINTNMTIPWTSGWTSMKLTFG